MQNFGLQLYNPGSSTWDEAATSAGSSGNVTLVFATADTTVPRLYRVAALNSCGVTAGVSSSARNIVLQSSLSGTVINLKWNRPVPGGSGTFTVWRDTGNGLREVAPLLTDTLWSEDYALFATEVPAGQVVYRITAADAGAPPGTPPHLSSATEVVVSESVFMPNAFTPDSNDENALFRPEFAFLPREYDFRIMSRTGVLLYRTGDPGQGWDGRHNGKPMPPGVYLWSLKLGTPSGGTVIRSGTVTILP
jgi:gliding motility-associated-like protein